MNEHTFKPFDVELRLLKEQLSTMGGLVQTQVAEAMAALIERDATHAQQIIEGDRAVDQLELAIDEQCIRMLAIRQPVASDLRFVASSLKIVTDLERIGDLAVNMAQRVVTLAESAGPEITLVDLPRMAEAAQAMLQSVMDAFIHSDSAKASSVLQADTAIDEMMGSAFNLLRAEMRRNPAMIDRCLATLFFAKHIERMADHTTNVAEMVIYFVRGRDVRHSRS